MPALDDTESPPVMYKRNHVPRSHVVSHVVFPDNFRLPPVDRSHRNQKHGSKKHMHAPAHSRHHDDSGDSNEGNDRDDEGDGNDDRKKEDRNENRSQSNDSDDNNNDNNDNSNTNSDNDSDNDSDSDDVERKRNHRKSSHKHSKVSHKRINDDTFYLSRSKTHFFLQITGLEQND